MITSNYQNLIEKLDFFIRRYYTNHLLRGIIYSTALVLLFFISITLLEYFAHFNTTVRSIIFYSFVISSGFVLIKYIVIPLLRLYKLGELISYETAAYIIGKHFATVQDKLLNVLQLQRQFSIATSHTQLLAAGIDQKISELKPIPFASAIDFSENKKYLKYAIIPVLFIVIVLVSAPRLLTDGAKRIVAHNTYFEKEAPFQFVITNNNLQSVAQQDFELKIKLTGNEIPNDAFINIDGNEFKLAKENIVNFSYLFKNVQKNILFQFVADGFKSKEYELVVLPNPILLDFEVSINYPTYLHKKEEVIKNTGDLIIPAGSLLSWNFNTKNTDQLKLSFTDTAFTVMPSSQNTFIYSNRLYKTKTYSITTANRFLKSKDSVTYSINVIPDAYPQIEVTEKIDSVFTKQIYFSGVIKDDYGFNKLVFNYRYITGNDSVVSQQKINMVIMPINKNVTQDQFFHHWNMSQLNIQPGDEIEYYFSIWDNDGVFGSKATQSQKNVFKAPTLKQLSENTDKNNDKIKNDLQESIFQAKDIQKEIAALQRKVAEKKTLTWEEKRKLQNLLDKQKTLQKKVEQIKNENQQNNNQQNEYKQVDEKVMEKQKQLENLFDKVMTPELKEKYEELQKLLDNLEKDKVQQALEKMKFDNKDVLKELDRNLEIFKQLEFEQKLQQNIDKLNELSKKQEELAKQSEEKKSDAKQQKERQEELNKQFEDLKKDLQEMEKKNNELETPNKIESTEKQQQEIQKEMQESATQLEQNQKKNASKSQKSAANKMQEMSNTLREQQQAEEEESQSEDINSLRSILENLIQLSFGQEALMGDLAKTKTNDPQYVKINQKQKKYQDDSKMIEDSLFALSKRVPQIKTIVNREISAINMNMEKAGEEIKEAQTISMDGRNHKQEALSRQQLAMTSINNLALMLDEALQQMQEQAKQSKPGAGSCKKPGGNGNKPSVANMRKMQEQLNQQIKKLKEGLEKGENKSGQKSGQGGMGMSQELAKLAAQQQAIRQEIQKMGDQINKDGKGVGNMSKLAEKMEETETDLVNKMLSQETIQRQEEILTKMLESEKAEKEREMDEKRQSNEAKNETYSNPNAFLEYKVLKQKETELLKTVPPSLTPFFKSKVNQYFNNFQEE